MDKKKPIIYVLLFCLITGALILGLSDKQNMPPPDTHQKNTFQSNAKKIVIETEKHTKSGIVKTDQDRLLEKYKDHSVIKVFPGGRELLEKTKIEKGVYRKVTRETDGKITIGISGVIDGGDAGYNDDIGEHPYIGYDISTLLSIAQNGDKYSYRVLAKKYQIERNYKDAEKWFLKAGESGQSVGYFDLFVQEAAIKGDENRRMAFLFLAGRAGNSPEFVRRIMEIEIAEMNEKELANVEELINSVSNN